MIKREIQVMIVDDEQEAIDYLSILLQENCPEVKVVSTATQPADALRKIFRYHPDLLFLDIKMEGKDGFEIAAEIQNENHPVHIIFVTAYDRYAIDAFKANALDYLLKPVDSAELQRVVQKFLDLRKNDFDYDQIRELIAGKNSKIRFNTRTGYILIDPIDMVYCQSDGNYSEIVLQDGSKKVVTSNLGQLLNLLPDSGFKRISRFHIIQERYLTEVDRSKHQCMLQFNNQQIALAYSSKIFKD